MFKMRTIKLGIIIFLLINFSFAAPLQYNEVVEVKDIPKNELFHRAELWFAETFNNSNYVLKIKNADNGELVGKVTIVFQTPMMLYSAANGTIDFMVKVYTKDGKYKYIFEDFNHYATNGTQHSLGLLSDTSTSIRLRGFTNNQTLRVYEWAKADISKIVESMKISLKNSMEKVSESENNDW